MRKFTSLMVSVVEVMLFGTASASLARVQGAAEDAERFVDRLNRGKDSWIRRVAMNLGTISLLAFVSIALAAIDAGTATAHHRENHTQGNNRDNDGRQSYNAGVLKGNMFLFPADEDISVSNKSKPALSNLRLYVKNSKNGTEAWAYVKFDVDGLNGSVISAKLLLRSITNSSFAGSLREVADNTWDSTMTWDNRPAIDFEKPALSEVGRVVSKTYYEWDVTSKVTGNGLYSFAMTCGSCSSVFESLEASMIPYLVVVEDDGSSVDFGVLSANDPVLVGAGDIARCGTTDPLGTGAQLTALLLDDIFCSGINPDGSCIYNYAGEVFTTGDGAYPNGSFNDYVTCYDPTWGRHFNWTNPSPGNHDYFTGGAMGYFDYFGAGAGDGDPPKGYYSYDIGSWHVVALNSNCFDIGGCGVGSPQYEWLQADLAASSASCTLAYLHHTPLSSGPHGSDLATQPLMDALHEFGAEVLVAGHDHIYERFMPQDADGVTDLPHGVRLFVVGSGGASLYAFQTPVANSEARFNDLNGVLKLTLHPSSYDWEFIPVEGTFSDVGSASCHDPLPGDPS